MVNLKVNLIEKLRMDKFYAEIELNRLSTNPNMNYEEKIQQMSDVLAKLSLLNAQLGLAEFYFQEAAAPQQVNAPASQPQGHVHPGQSHGE